MKKMILSAVAFAVALGSAVGTAQAKESYRCDHL